MNSIDFTTKTFKSGGVEYRIDTEAIGYERLVVYLELMPVVAVGKSHLEIMNLLAAVYKGMTSGNDILGAQWNASLTLYNTLRELDGANSPEFLQKNLDSILRFCALFCIAEGEDTTVYDKAVIDKKIESFKKDVDMWGFFLLARTLVPLYQKRLADIRGTEEKLKEQAKKPAPRTRRT